MNSPTNPKENPMPTVETPPCALCGQTSLVEVTEAEKATLFDPNRPNMQVAFPHWDADKREMMITGTHPACWDAMFADDEEEG